MSDLRVELRSGDLVVRRGTDGAPLALAGRLDVHSAADARLLLADAVDALAGTGAELVLDLADLSAVDATGLGVLVGAHRRAVREGQVLVLQDVTPGVSRVLHLTRLDRVLRQHRTTACA